MIMDKQTILKKVSKNGRIIQFVNSQLQDYREIVLAAVKNSNNGKMISYNKQLHYEFLYYFKHKCIIRK